MLLLSNKVGLNIVNLDYEKIKNQGDEIDIVINLGFLNDLTLNSYYNFKDKRLILNDNNTYEIIM